MIIKFKNKNTIDTWMNLKNLRNIKYNHSFKNGSLSESCWASQNPLQGAGTTAM
jgi:hypothetical protein